MFKDFEIVPKLINRGKLLELFTQRRMDRPGPDKDLVFIHLMDFIQFSELLVQVAFLVYPIKEKRLFSTKITPSIIGAEYNKYEHEGAAKVDALIDYMGLTVPKQCRVILQTKGATRKAQLNYGVPGQHSVVEPIGKRNTAALASRDLVSRKVASYLTERFDPYIRSSSKRIWKPFDGAYIDMGKVFVDSVNKFRITVFCSSSALIKVDITIHNLYGVEVDYKTHRIAQGLDLKIQVTANPKEAGEMHGFIRVLGYVLGVDDRIKEYQLVDIPVYCYCLETDSILGKVDGTTKPKTTIRHSSGLSSHLLQHRNNVKEHLDGCIVGPNNDIPPIVIKPLSRPSSAPSKRQNHHYSKKLVDPKETIIVSSTSTRPWSASISSHQRAQYSKYML
jgi:hypothetical protein